MSRLIVKILTAAAIVLGTAAFLSMAAFSTYLFVTTYEQQYG